MQRTLHDLLQALEDAARRTGRPPPRLLAVSKLQPATAVAELAGAMRRERPGMRPLFGENYVQEARAKQAALAGLDAEWHLIGHLQSNKAAEAAGECRPGRPGRHAGPGAAGGAPGAGRATDGGGRWGHERPAR